MGYDEKGPLAILILDRILNIVRIFKTQIDKCHSKIIGLEKCLSQNNK